MLCRIFAVLSFGATKDSAEITIAIALITGVEMEF